MAALILKRPEKYIDKMRSYNVYLDHKKIGKIGNNQIKTFELSSGKHTIDTRIDFLKSLSIDFEVQSADSTVHMCVKNNATLWEIGLVSAVGAFASIFVFKHLIDANWFLGFLGLFLFIGIVLKIYYSFKPYLTLEIEKK